MGHVYAVFVLPLINIQMMRRVRNLWQKNGQLYFMNDPTTLQQGVVVQGEDVAVYVHVDDFGVQAAHDRVANEVATLIQEDSNAVGLPAKIKYAGTVTQFIGLRPISSPPSWAPSPTKLGAVEQAIMQLLAKYWVDLRWVHQVVSQYVYLSLLWRPGLSAPHALFQQIRL